MAIFCECREKSVCCPKKRLTVHFGQKGASDYTIHGDDDRKEQYLARHEANERWDDPFTAGSLAKNLLWNKKTLKASIADFKQQFDL